jgi:hypothetical protein
MPYLISSALGGIGALLLYSLVKVGIYIAGGVLGLVLTILLVSLLKISVPWLVGLLLLAGTCLVGFFGRRLGNTIIALAMAAAGAFQVIYGLSVLFIGQVAPETYTAPAELLNQPVALAVFLIVAAVSALSQLQRRTGVVQVIR